jgi:hypothetical protein
MCTDHSRDCRSSVGQPLSCAAVARQTWGKRELSSILLMTVANIDSVLAAPVDTGNAISNAIPI